MEKEKVKAGTDTNSHQVSYRAGYGSVLLNDTSARQMFYLPTKRTKIKPARDSELLLFQLINATFSTAQEVHLSPRNHHHPKSVELRSLLETQPSNIIVHFLLIQSYNNRAPWDLEQWFPNWGAGPPQGTWGSFQRRWENRYNVLYVTVI